MKISTISVLSSTITFFCAFFVMVLLYLSLGDSLFSSSSSVWVIYLVGIVAIFFLCYLLLDKYVFSKIKVIYQYIQDSKTTGSKYNNATTSIQDVHDDVKDWAESTQERIDSLTSLAHYRKNFVGNISHELKTPIFSIQGYLHTLIEGGLYDSSINEKYLLRAARNVDRLQSIVEDLEKISQFESSKIQLNYTNFDAYQLIKEIFLDAEMANNPLEIKFVFGSEELLKYMVIADRNLIRQALENLLVNSIKYGKPSGTTEIKLHNIDDKILFEISDNGLGIKEKHLEHLFDRFYRVEESRARNQGGSGLGLSIVKHIIEAHGQSIKVQSVFNEGSTFWFSLKRG